MKKGIQDKLSLVAVYIRLHFGEQFITNASGFLWEKEGKAFLISNWHCFTGREPDTKKPKSNTAAIPNRVECYLYTNKLSDGQPLPGYRKESVFFPLTQSNSLEPLFFEHKACSSNIDIAALPVELPDHIVPFFLNAQPFDERIEFYPGQDAFVIGYPLGILTGNSLPVWKRASISTEPYIPIAGLKKFT